MYDKKVYGTVSIKNAGLSVVCLVYAKEKHM